MKKWLVLFLCLIATPHFAQQPQIVSQNSIPLLSVSAEVQQKALSVENEFIKISVNGGPFDQGRFAIDTTLGDPKNPADDHKSLIFGRPIPWTSYTTILIDGEAYVFGGINKKIEKRAGKAVKFGKVVSQTVSKAGIVTECQFGNVRVIQYLKFFRNPSTRVKDSVMISYEVLNMDAAPHKVGVRLMLDTKLGDNDGAPFRIGEQAIQSEQVFKGSSIQDYWQAFDSLTSPNVIAQGVLRAPEEGISPPDRLYLVNWGTVADSPWDFDYQEGRSFIRAGEFEKDTALALYWDPFTVQPQKSRECSTLYGLGGVSRSAGSLSLGLTAPAEVYASSKKEILVLAYVSNTSEFDSRDTKVTFKLPDGFVLTAGSLTTDLGTFIAGRTRQIPLKMRVLRSASGSQKISVSVSSSTFDPNTISRTIDIQAAPTVKTTLYIPDIKIITLNNYIEVRAKITNQSTRVNLDQISVKLNPDSAVELPSYERQIKVINKLNMRDSAEVSWILRVINPSQKNSSLSVTVAAPLLDTETFSQSLQFSIAPQRFYLEPSTIAIKKGGYFYVLISGDYVTSFEDLNANFTFNPNKVEFQRLSPEDWVVQSLQEENLRMESGKLSILGLKNLQSAFKKRIAKLHFQATQPGEVEFRFTDGKQVSAITITVVE